MIIGGMFGLQQTAKIRYSIPPFLNEKNIFLVNARSGISLIIETLSPPRVWVPSFLCRSILDAINNNDTCIKFYEVDYDLLYSSFDWLNKVGRGDLVIFIDYFGFPCNVSSINRAKEQGCWVLEDASQAMLSSEVGKFSDFVLFSPRKFLGIPDGGILSINKKIEFDYKIELHEPPAKWWLIAFRASVLRQEFDKCNESRPWFKLFQKAEAGSPIGNYSMSQLSKMLLFHSFDYSTIARRRINNFQVLSNKLGALSLFPNLPPNVVPLGYPIRLKNRDKLRKRLIERKIYPPIHWAIHNFVPSEFKSSHRLSSEIMTLPCDQRYESHHMTRMANIICEIVQK